MSDAIYGLQDLPGGASDDLRINVLPGRSLVLSIAGEGDRFAHIVLWEDRAGLRAAYLDIDARPLKRRKSQKQKATEARA